MMRTFVNRGKDKLLFWAIGIDEDDQSIVHMHSWVEDSDKKKKTWDRPGSIGKEGTKAYRDPETYALIRIQQEIDKKLKQGYREVQKGEDLSTMTKTVMSFSNPPKGLSLWKPKQKPEDGTKEYAKMTAVIDRGDAIFTIKRDGNRHLITIDEAGEVNIFTRRLDCCTEWYPWLKWEIENLKLPARTLLDVELVVEKDGIDDRRTFQSLSRSLKKRAIDLQQINPWKRPKAIVIGTPIWAGQEIITKVTVDEWMEHLYYHFEDRVRGTEFVEMMEILPSSSFEDCKQLVIDEKSEGLVIYDSKACFGDDGIVYNGHPKRPSVWKWVPEYEGDFIVVFDPDNETYVIGGGWGKGRRKNFPGQVALYQFGGDGDLHYVSLCGSGFDDTSLQEVIDRAAANGGQCAGVAKVKYRGRTFISEGEKTNALTIPVFMHWRDDKTLEEAQDDRLVGAE